PDPEVYLPADPDQRPAVLLELLRADLILRWGARERRPVEWYRDRFPELDDESLVALLYEEYCLREEAGESPEAAEYRARFPDLAAAFQEVLEIHGLIGRGGGSDSRGPCPDGVPLPEAGQTIAGFRLVEELGRGAFARVYLAEERHLADRPVALKVTRTGSREPQTLARLQHTHIVPVYSYRTDPATGLHLLCMPYLGRITLLQLVNQPEIRTARTGADLLSLLDRLGPHEDALAQRSASRRALARLTYPRVIAWWGARMAEALQHAHDRQVLHRDVKPSNVLMTGDGLPMLLDFNLAQEPWIPHDGAAPAAFGGTLAYMAPEHLEALAEGGTNPADARSDLYALGVVLFDCLVRGTRSFALPSQSMMMTEALRRAAAARRDGAPRLRDTHPDVPPALEAVVRRCLAPEPCDRYASAAQLAADLQAVAEDGPLRFAREPIASRVRRGLRRNGRRLAIATALVLPLGVIAYSLVDAQLASLRLRGEVSQWFDLARQAADEGGLELAISRFATARQLAQGDPRLRGLLEQIQEQDRLARATKAAWDQADALFQVGESLRFSLLGFSGDPNAAWPRVQAELAKFAIPDDPGWIHRPAIALLDRPRRDRLIGEVNELLFLWVAAWDRERHGDPAAARRAIPLCDVALAFARPAGPWRAIRARWAADPTGDPPPSQVPTRTEGETSARGCFQWAQLCDLEGRREAAIAWLERATQLEPQDYWSQFLLGDYCWRLRQAGRAMEHYQAAVALRPDSPWARCNRSVLYHDRGDWELALDDLNRALASPQAADLPEARLELGVVKQVLGDDAGARAAFESVIATAPGTWFARAGRLNRAKLDFDAGAIDRAWAEYDALLAEDPRDDQARKSRALLALQLDRAAQAEADLTLLLRDVPEQADELLARRALARLALGRPDAAEEDAAVAYRRNPSPSRERLWIRTLLAAGRVEDLFWLNRPDDLTILPGGGPALMTDLRAAEQRLRALAEGSRGRLPHAHRTRAVILSALDDPAAEAEATRALALAPESADAYLVRARVRCRAGDRQAALADVESALALMPGDPRLLEFRGVLKTELGNPAAALLDLDRAILRGASGTVRVPRARALMALGHDEAARRDWSLALEKDPEDPEAYLGRARTLIRLGRPNRALVDLEEAAVWVADNPRLLPQITAAYALCLGSRPDRFPRWLSLAQRAWSTWIATARPGPG
ncbi:MAG TPA: protein kinase, partial [Isosphaeraceae bacterium]|nr:protein kinase [Isosphaeraceae bacterium]